MPSFGKNSKKNRNTCHPDLQRVLDEAIKHFDFSCIWGHRGRDAQNWAYNTGHSTLMWPKSKHNAYPSLAFDVVPYPGGFRVDDKTFYLMATHILGAASKLRIPLRWGGHWSNFRDLAHFEMLADD